MVRQVKALAGHVFVCSWGWGLMQIEHGGSVWQYGWACNGFEIFLSFCISFFFSLAMLNWVVAFVYPLDGFEASVFCRYCVLVVRFLDYMLMGFDKSSCVHLFPPFAYQFWSLVYFFVMSYCLCLRPGLCLLLLYLPFSLCIVQFFEFNMIYCCTMLWRGLWEMMTNIFSLHNTFSASSLSSFCAVLHFLHFFDILGFWLCSNCTSLIFFDIFGI